MKAKKRRCRYGLTKWAIDRHEFEKIARKYFKGVSFFKLMAAFAFSKVAHKEQFRNDGYEYFDHTKITVLIILEEFRVRILWILILAFLHDVIEDVKEITKAVIVFMFGEKIGRGADLLNKNSIGKRRYIPRLRRFAIWGVLLVKFADRLHNLRNIMHETKVFRRKQLKKTREEILPLLPVFARRAPKRYRYLAPLIESEFAHAMRRIEKSLLVKGSMRIR